MLASIQASPVDDKIAELQRFLTQNSSYANAYMTLLEWYVYYDRIELGKSYFQQLSKEPAFAQNAHWMLAKSYQLQDMPEKAFLAFVAALKSSEPQIGLLYEFVEFDHFQSYRFNGSSILKKLDLSNDLRKLVQAFYDYFQLNDQSVIDAVIQLPFELTQHSIVLDMWGTNYLYLLEPRNVIAKWRLGYERARSHNDLRMESRFLTNLGFLAQEVDKDYELALARYDSAYAIAEHASDFHRMQMLFGYRGYIYREMGFFKESEKQFKEAIRICTNLLEPRFLADWQKGYGLTLYHLARYREAFDELHKGEKIAEKSNNVYYIVPSLFDRAELYMELKQYVLAQKDLEAALKIANENEMTYERETAQVMFGRIRLEQGRYAEARKFFLNYIRYLQVTPTHRKKTYQWTGKVAETYYREGNIDKASDFYLQALNEAVSVEARNFQGWCQLNLGDIAANQGRLESASRYYDNAFEIASEENATEMLWKTYLGYGKVQRLSGKLPQAIVAYKQAAEIMEKIRNDLDVDRLRMGYFVEGQQVYKALTDCYLERYKLYQEPADIDNIYYYLSMGRSRGLLDIQLHGRKTTYSAEYLKAVRELRILQRLLRARQFGPESERANLLSQITNVRLTVLAQKLRSPNLDDESYPVDNYSFPTLSDIGHYIERSGQGLLVYNLAEHNSFALVVVDGEREIVPLDSVDSNINVLVDSLVNSFHQIVRPDAIQRLLYNADLAYRLYRFLVKPIEDQIALPENLLIVPDIAVMNLPFEMLLTARPTRRFYSPKDYPDYAPYFLVQHYSITYTPSMFHVSNTLAEPKIDPNMVIFANPQFSVIDGPGRLSLSSTQRSGWQFGSLPYTAFEAAQISKIHDNIKVFMNYEATKSTLEAELALNDVVHIATHGFLDSTFDAFSGLALSMSDDTTDDGLLMGYEIQDLDIHCDLVTLSACETGRGRVVIGEGVLGLPRLFIGAGANTVLMTLWKIEDRFASEIMPLFYDKYLNQGFTKSGALSEAKRAMIRQSESTGEETTFYQHPFYWAAFTLYGDPGSKSDRSVDLWIWLVSLLVCIVLCGTVLIRAYQLKDKQRALT